MDLNGIVPMKSAVIIDAVRSPLAKGRPGREGRPGGELSSIHSVELLGQVLSRLMDRNDVDPGLVDDVLVGCVSQSAEQASTPGRWAWLAADLPEHVPATTIDRRCGSSQQAAHFGAQAIMAGAYEIAVVAGLESMSRVPMGSARGDADPFGPGATERYGGFVPQGASAELIAARGAMPRSRLDEYAARSHERAAKAARSGAFDDEIVPIHVPGHPGTGPTIIDADETIRPGTTAQRLSTLPPAFQDDALAARFPDIDWRITAGNSSQLSDGAAAMLLTADETAARLGLRPRARIHSFAVVADDPIMMLTGPMPATEKILRSSGLRLDDIDHVEINEAFAPVPLAWADHFEVDDATINTSGGAIALGHPLGASGVRLMTTMLNSLESIGGRYGLQVMCEAGGMANATLIERLD